jgi:hypothetical protein
MLYKKKLTKKVKISRRGYGGRASFQLRRLRVEGWAPTKVPVKFGRVNTFYKYEGE